MGFSRYLFEQQAEAPPPQKYELPEEVKKAGLFKRFSVGLLLSGAFVLLKDVLFSWGNLATARAESAANVDPENGFIEPPSLAVVVASEPTAGPAGSLSLVATNGRPVLERTKTGSAMIG